MNSLILFVTTGFCLLTFAVHFFVGGKHVAAPLLADQNLPRGSKWLNYYTWHITSLLLALMSGAYFWAGWSGRGEALIAFFALSSLSFSALSAYVARRGAISPLRFPSTSLFAGLALLSGLALWL